MPRIIDTSMYTPDSETFSSPSSLIVYDRSGTFTLTSSIICARPSMPYDSIL